MKKTICERPVIAITGSAGKTTTKEMIASILKRRWSIFKSIENGNDVWYTSEYVKQINASHEAVVLEFGITHPGNLRQHCQLIQPNYGVITNIGTAHIGNFEGQIKEIALAKSELIKGMKSTGALFLNADDIHSKLLETHGFKGEIITVGSHSQCAYQARNVHFNDDGMVFQVGLDGQNHTFHIPILGTHNVINALLAIAVSHHMGFSESDIKSGLESYEKPYSRLIVYRLRGIKLIDDTFNANPEAAKAAIDVLSQIGKGANIAILGSMLELGKYSVEGHKNVGRYLAGKKIDYLHTFGHEAGQIGEGAIESGFPPDKVVHCITMEQLHHQLVGKLEPNTTLLIKGSNKLNMHETVFFLRNCYKAMV